MRIVNEDIFVDCANVNGDNIAIRHALDDLVEYAQREGRGVMNALLEELRYVTDKARRAEFADIRA